MGRRQIASHQEIDGDGRGLLEREEEKELGKAVDRENDRVQKECRPDRRKALDQPIFDRAAANLAAN